MATTPSSDIDTSGDVIDFLNISVGNDESTRNYKTSDHLMQFVITCFKYSLLVGILTLNFLGLSISLNCNINESFSQRILSGVFAFFFGFIYLLVNYYTFRVLIRGKVCPMNPDKLFPMS